MPLNNDSMPSSKQLYNAGAELESLDEKGNTPFMHLAIPGPNACLIPTMELLLRLGDDINRLNNRNQSAFYLVTVDMMLGPKTVQYLLDNGADPNHGGSPLARARESNDF